MGNHPYENVAIVSVHNTRQARVLEGHDSLSIAVEAAIGAIEKARIDTHEIDGIYGSSGTDLAYVLGLGPTWMPMTGSSGVAAVLDAASAIAAGHCRTVLIAGGGAGIYTQRDSTAPWTRPSNEFVVSFGMYTAMEFALIARRHMEVYGTTPEHLATAAATIRNHGHVNPEAVYYGRGPYTADDVLNSRMVADPFHLLDCSITGEGGSAMILTTAARARHLTSTPVYILGGGIDRHGPAYKHPPSFDLRGHGTDDTPNGFIGKRAAQRAFAMGGLTPNDVDVCEFYDPFSFEIIRQFEAYGFCEPGEGGDFVLEGNISMDGRFPTTTDGGLLSFSHGGGTVQMLQRVIRGVEQIQRTCVSNQVPDVDVALCTNGGAGALFDDVILLGKERP
ncbi:MAG: thiolase family protein [Acidimicrobiia bacterium]